METANKIFINRKFNCSAAELFEWLVQPEMIIQWFGPKHLSVESVTNDLSIGGQYSIKISKGNEQYFFIEGQYLEIKSPTLLSFSFQYRGLPSPPPDSTVHIKIEDLGDCTCQLFLNQGFEIVPADIVNRTNSWEYMLNQLIELI